MFIVICLGLASVGASHPPLLALHALMGPIVGMFWLAAATALAAVALLPLRRFWRDSGSTRAMHICVSVALVVFAVQIIGPLVTITPTLDLVARALMLAACVFWLVRILRRNPTTPALGTSLAPTWPWLFALVPAAVLLVAAANPPGWLWGSEFGGFDSLSYHLQLPQEWIARGTVTPVEHNMYSYLPNALEILYRFLGTPDSAATAPALKMSAGEPWGMLATGRITTGAVAAQGVHAAFTLLTVFILFLLVRTLLARAAVTNTTAIVAAALAAALFLATPWIIVVGSLTYNEMGVTFFFAAVLLASIDPKLSPLVRGSLVGAFVGLACTCKPTALLFVAPPVGIVLLANAPPKVWVRVIFSGSVLGTITLLPWLLRNEYACGNPVFPYLASTFGSAHWNAEQLARYASGHHFSGSLLDRLRMLVFADPTDPAGTRHRGMLHGQWGLFFPLAVFAIAAAFTLRPARRDAALLSIGLVLQILAWLSFTHLQSRFLVPLAVPAAALFGLACARILTPRSTQPMPLPRTHALRVLCALPIVVQTLILLSLFVHERDIDRDRPLGNPNLFLVAGVDAMSGEAFRREFDAASAAEKAKLVEQLTPVQYINLALPANAKIALIGDAGPLYFLRPITYATTWDTLPIAPMVAAHPDDQSWWAQPLQDQGIEYVLLNLGELDRYKRSGWLDPRLGRPEDLSRWLQASAHIVHAWPRAGTALFRFKSPGELLREGTIP